MKTGSKVRVNDGVKTYAGQTGRVTCAYGRTAWVRLDGWSVDYDLPFDSENELTLIEEGGISHE